MGLQHRFCPTFPPARAIERGYCHVRWGCGLLLLLAGTACQRDSASVPPSPTPIPAEKVECTEILEYIRMRPITKSCEKDADCVVQQGDCCDRTAVHQRYARPCERTCQQECPTDTLIGRQLTDLPVCTRGICELKTVAGDAENPAGK